MSTNTLRTLHSYIGAFTAPAILFFALSGSFQLFNLHEKHGHYRPPALLEKLAQIHKDQAFSHHEDDDHAPPPATTKPAATPLAAAASDDDDDDAPTPVALALKIFFLIVSISLISSTIMGLWIGLSNARRKTLSWVLFGAGILVPVALVMLL